MIEDTDLYIIGYWNRGKIAESISTITFIGDMY